MLPGEREGAAIVSQLISLSLTLAALSAASGSVLPEELPFYPFHCRLTSLGIVEEQRKHWDRI